jgi:hypothetical protein
MQIVPAPRITRFAQLNSGDLFFWRHGLGACVAIVAEDPTPGGEKFALPLGPEFPVDVTGPTLINANGTTVVSFGKEYVLRLPVRPKEWLDTSPPRDTHCILVTEQGTYFRANFSRQPVLFSPCYVDVVTGLICARSSGSAGQFVTPSGTQAFALQWEIVTTESNPRAILRYPYPSPSAATAS